MGFHRQGEGTSSKQYVSEQSNKEREEKACASCFLGWYNHQYGVNYALKRAEKVFHELKDRTRWDFVTRRNDSKNGWFTIEIKKLIRPQTRIQFVRWGRIFKAVTKELEGLLRGEFLVVGTPFLQLDQSDRLKLRKVFSQVILKNARNMKRNDSVDLGAEILAEFPRWPFTPDLKMLPTPHIVRNAYELRLFKISDSGCSVEPGASPPDIFYVAEAVTEAIDELFNPAKDGVLQANEQLALAKAKGIKSTVLLLDCRLPWHPNTVKQVLAHKDSSFMSNIDVIYLVKVSQKRVIKVWPSGMNQP